jgi:hypothetical protein
MADVDLPVAESAYATLLDARNKPRNMAADLVRLLKTDSERSWSTSRNRNSAGRSLAGDLCAV